MNAASKAQALELEAAHQDQAELERVIEGLEEGTADGGTAQRARELESRATGKATSCNAAQPRARWRWRDRRCGGDGSRPTRTWCTSGREGPQGRRGADKAIRAGGAGAGDARRSRGGASRRVLQPRRRNSDARRISRTVAPLAGILAIISLTGALSWAIAREIAPAKFAATAVLKAEGRDRNLNGGELAEWQKLHEGLISDPGTTAKRWLNVTSTRAWPCWRTPATSRNWHSGL